MSDLSSLSFVDRFLRKEKSLNLNPFFIGSCCCSLEVESHQGQHSKFHDNNFNLRPSIEHDVLILSGNINFRNKDEILRIYNELPEKKWVVVVGDCAINGGEFADSYAINTEVKDLFPVDVYIHGAPPRPEDLDIGFSLLKQKVLQDDYAAKPLPKKETKSE
ncbi:MAG: NADH-quinone oxidoreductase subunit B [Oligoflexia bacterium]|nr:NADH-quinone oxidoreductase subunit B [Oligoflexia bacterium]